MMNGRVRIGQICRATSGGLVLALGLMHPAWSTDGKITFIGSIVAPMCNVSNLPLASFNDTSFHRVSDRCERIRIEHRFVQKADFDDVLIRYFASYGATGGSGVASGVELVTVTYE